MLGVPLTANRLYLPLDPKKDRPAVAAQEAAPNSLLNAVRDLSQLRHATRALQADSGFVPLYAVRGKYPFVYLRRLGHECVQVAINPSAAKVEVRLKTRTHAQPETLRAGDARAFDGAGALRLEMQGVSYGTFRVQSAVFPAVASLTPKARGRGPRSHAPSGPR